MSRRRHTLRSSALTGSLLLALTGLPVPTVALAESTTAIPPGTPEGSTQTIVPLGLTDVAAVVVHEFAERLFYSSGAAGDTVLVTDLTGQEVGRLTGLAGPTGMAPGENGSLWVALARGHEIVEYDAQTLTVKRRIALPQDQCPGDLAVNNRYLVYGYSCIGYTGEGVTGGVGQFEYALEEPVLGYTTKGPVVRPVVGISQEFWTRAVAAESGDPGPAAGPTASALDLGGVTPAVLATVPIGRGLQDVGVHHWYQLLVAATTDPAEHRTYHLPPDRFGTTVTEGDALAAPGRGRALAWSGFTSRFATASVNPVGPDVVVHSAFTVPGSSTAETAAFASFELGPDAVVEPGGLGMDAQGRRVFAVARDGAGRLALHTLTLPSGATATVAGPSSAYAGGALTLTGRVTFADGEVPVGEYVGVERSVSTPTGVVTTWLPGVVTDTSGAFTITDTPTTAGSTTYAVRFDRGDYAQTRATGAWTVDVKAKAPATVDVTGPVTAPVGRELTLTGTVVHPDGSSPAGGTVTVERYTGTGSAVTLAPVAVTPNGAFRVTDTPSATGQTGYAVTYNGTGHTGTDRITVDVQKRAASLAVTGPASTYVGEPTRLTGSLALSDGSPGAGQTLGVVRTLNGTRTTLPAVTTRGDGTFVVDDTPAATGTASYAVTYSTAVEQAAAGTSLEVKSKIGSTLSASGPSSVTAGSALTLSGRLTHADGSAGAGVRLDVVRTHPSGSVALPPVTTGPDGGFTIPDTAPTAGEAVYTVRYAGDAVHAPAAARATVPVTLNPTELTLAATLDKKRGVVALVAHLGPTKASRVVRLTAQPSGGTTVTVLEAAVDANGDLRASYQIGTTTTFTASFAADGWNAAATASKTVRR